MARRTERERHYLLQLHFVKSGGFGSRITTEITRGFARLEAEFVKTNPERKRCGT